MKDIIFKIIDTFTQGVDVYHNKESMWLIFTDKKKWIIELTNEGTLWYNFYFFQDCFKYVSLDVVKNQHYIIEWVESIIQNGVKITFADDIYVTHKAEEINRIIKETHDDVYHNNGRVQGVIKNGIKETIRLLDKSGEINEGGEYC